MTPRDWLTTPLTGVVSHLVSIALWMAATVAVGVASWVIRLPGPLTQRERTEMAPRRQKATRLRSWTYLLAPVGMMAALWQLTVPLRPPAMLVLASRSRTWRSADEEAWRRGTESMRHTLGNGKSDQIDVIDAGVVVDTALAVANRVIQSAGPGAAIDRAILEDSIRFWLRRYVSPGIMSSVTRPVSAVTWSGGASPSDASLDHHLPRSLIESVELTVLKALSQMANVTSVALVVADRETPSGWVWEGAAAYLTTGGARGAEAHVTIDTVRETPAMRIVDANVTSSQDGKLTVAIQLEVPGRARGYNLVPPAPVRFQLRAIGDRTYPSASSVQVTFAPMPRLVTAIAQFPLPSPSARSWQLGIDGDEDSWTPLLRLIGDRELIQVGLRADAPLNQRLHATLTHLVQDDVPQGSAIARWREWMSAYGFPVTSGAFKIVTRTCDRSAAGIPVDVIIDGCPHNGTAADALRVYPVRFDVTRVLATTLAVDTIAQIPRSHVFVRGAVENAAMPGLYSFDNLPLQSDTFYLTHVDGSQSTCTMVSARLVAESFLDPLASGQFFRFPIVQEDVISRDVVVTTFGFSAGREGMLVDRAGVSSGVPPEAAHLLAAWTHLLAAVRSAASARSACLLPAPAVDTAAPTPYLRAADITALRGHGMFGSVVLFSLALGLYAWSVRAMLRSVAFDQR
jgi:hypothetical protein